MLTMLLHLCALVSVCRYLKIIDERRINKENTIEKDGETTIPNSKKFLKYVSFLTLIPVFVPVCLSTMEAVGRNSFTPLPYSRQFTPDSWLIVDLPELTLTMPRCHSSLAVASLIL